MSHVTCNIWTNWIWIIRIRIAYTDIGYPAPAGQTRRDDGIRAAPCRRVVVTGFRRRRSAIRESARTSTGVPCCHRLALVRRSIGTLRADPTDGPTGRRRPPRDVEHRAPPPPPCVRHRLIGANCSPKSDSNVASTEPINYLGQIIECQLVSQWAVLDSLGERINSSAGGRSEAKWSSPVNCGGQSPRFAAKAHLQCSLWLALYRYPLPAIYVRRVSVGRGPETWCTVSLRMRVRACNIRLTDESAADDRWRCTIVRSPLYTLSSI